MKTKKNTANNPTIFALGDDNAVAIAVKRSAGLGRVRVLRQGALGPEAAVFAVDSITETKLDELTFRTEAELEKLASNWPVSRLAAMPTPALANILQWAMLPWMYGFYGEARGAAPGKALTTAS